MKPWEPGETPAEYIDRMEAEINRLRAEHTLAVEMLTSAEKECAELRAEIEHLRSTIVGADREIKASHADGDRLRAENERLAAQLVEAEKYNGYHQQSMLEIERLKAALRQIISEADSDDGLTAWDGSDIARRALGGAPDPYDVNPGGQYQP